MTFTAEAADGGLVAAAKMNGEGGAIPKQRKLRDDVSIPRLLNPSPTVLPGFPGAPSWLPFEAPIPMKPKRKKKITRKAALHEHVGKYKVVLELSRAPSCLTFGQLVHGDAEATRREINDLCSITTGARAGY